MEGAVHEAQAGGDLESGLRAVVQTIQKELAANEIAWRKLLGQSLDLPPTEGLTFELERGVGRQGRRVRWFTDTLLQLRDRIPSQTFNTLVAALTATAGLEAMCALRDVCGLSVDEAARIQEWAAVALLHQVLAEATDRL